MEWLYGLGKRNEKQQKLNMKKLTKILAIAIIVLSLTSCYRVQPNGDEESVLVSKPFFFGHGGVDETPVSSGATWVAATTDHIEFKIVPMKLVEEFENVMTKDNTPLGTAVNVTFQIEKGKTPLLYKNFGAKWYDNSISPGFRTSFRNEFSKYELFDLSSKRQTSVNIQNFLRSYLEARIKVLGLPVKVIDISVGGITPPDEVLNETKKTAAHNQEIYSQTQRALAESARKQAEVNKAIADKAYQKEMGMTTQEYLSLRHLEIEKEKVELIKNNKNISIIFGNANPVFPVR